MKHWLNRAGLHMIKADQEAAKKAKKSSSRGIALARKREALKEHENGEKYKL